MGKLTKIFYEHFVIIITDIKTIKLNISESVYAKTYPINPKSI